MDDDSGMGCLLGGLFVLVLIGLLIKAIITILVAIVTAIAIVITVIGMVLFGLAAAAIVICLFVVAGMGGNWLVRAALGSLNHAEELTPQSLRVGLAVLYGAPVVFLLVSLVFVHEVQSDVLLWVWIGLLPLSTPAYYWTWWSDTFTSRQVQKEQPLKIDSGIPGIQLTVPFTLDATLKAEEQIVWAEILAWQAMTRFDAKL